MMERDAIETVRDTVETSDFYRPFNQKIFDAILALCSAGMPVDVMTLHEELRNRKTLDEVGGAAYLTALIEACPSAANVKHYARSIIALACERERIAIAEFMASTAYQGDGNAMTTTLVARLQALDERSADTEFSDDTSLDAIVGNNEWLWPNWVLRGFVTTVVAPQGAGKSHFCLDLCARLMQGQSWPDGTRNEIPCDKLLWIDTEMAVAALLQRLLDAKLPRGHFIFPADPLLALTLDNPAHIAWIEKAIKRFRPPLIVVDALSGAHRGEEKSNDHMKGVMIRLSEIAQKYKVAIIAVHHLRKASEMEPSWPISLDRVRGASAITQYSRTVIALGAPDVQQPTARRVEVIKSNFAPPPEPLGYEITSIGMAWGKAPEMPVSSKPLEAARNWLLQTLEEGMRAVDELKAECEARGEFGWRTVESAKGSLCLTVARQGGRNGQWFWSLPNATNSFAQEELKTANEIDMEER